MKRHPASKKNDYDIFSNAVRYVVTSATDHWVLKKTEIDTLDESIELATSTPRSLIYAVTQEGKCDCMTVAQVKEFLSETGQT